MSDNPFDGGFVPEDDDTSEDFEPDIATVAFLDQQQAEFGNMEADFEATYGFKHECHCGEDYAAGKVGEITQCYHNMMQEALATCARLNAELNEMTGIAQALYQELRENHETAASSDEVQSKRLTVLTGGKAVDSESEADGSTDAGNSAAADSSGEGFGVQGEVAGNKNDEGTPGDRKLV